MPEASTFVAGTASHTSGLGCSAAAIFLPMPVAIWAASAFAALTCIEFAVRDLWTGCFVNVEC